MTENELYLVKEYNFDDPLIKKIDSLIDNSIRDCHNKYFHTFEFKCVYNIKLTIIGNNGTIDLTISDKSMGLFELNKKLTIARERGFIFNHINNFKRKIYSNLSHINIHYHLRLGTPPLYHQFFRSISHNPEYIQTFCNDRTNPFHFACRQWYSYNKI